MQCLGTNHEATVKIFQKHYGQDFPYEIYKKEMAALFHEQAADGRLPKNRESVSYWSFKDFRY